MAQSLENLTSVWKVMGFISIRDSDFSLSYI